MVTASDTARRRVTRDLHDGAQQRFVTTIINLQLAQQKWASAPQRAEELLGVALRDARLGLEDLREIVAGIHPAILARAGAAAAIDALAARLPIPVRLDVPDGRLPDAIEESVASSAANRSPAWSSTPARRPRGCEWNSTMTGASSRWATTGSAEPSRGRRPAG